VSSMMAPGFWAAGGCPASRGQLVKDLKDKVVALTGAGSGIGRGTAMALVRQGARLALADINEDGLNETASMVAEAGGRVSTTILDVSSRQSVDDWCASAIEEHGQVDVVVNNAGVTLAATGADQNHEDVDWVMGINFWGVVYGTRAFLPHMLERDSGHIVNISSIFGLFGVPSQSAYCASKFAVRGYSDSIRAELRNTNVKVTVVHPGGIRTNIANSARFKLQGEAVPPREEFVANANKLLARTEPADAGEKIVSAIQRDKARLLIGGDALVADIFQRLMPVRFPLIMAGR
jgi:NADP-dependent 3-hydroxy acid dehydrogenase YdfG